MLNEAHVKDIADRHWRKYVSDYELDRKSHAYAILREKFNMAIRLTLKNNYDLSSCEKLFSKEQLGLAAVIIRGNLAGIEIKDFLIRSLLVQRNMVL